MKQGDEMEIYLRDAIHKMQDILNTENNILETHGEKVAYIYYHLLVNSGKFYTIEQLYSYICLAILHDIGAYKTDTIADLLKFEVKAPHKHAIYGYIFAKHYLNLPGIEELFLYHHFTEEDFQKLGKEINLKKEMRLLTLADRIAVLWDSGMREYTTAFREKLKKLFTEKDITIFEKANTENEIFENLENGNYYAKVYAFFGETKINTQVVEKLMEMLGNTVDFKSEYTMFHTITVTSITKVISEKFGFNQQEIAKMCYAASIHDIGKLYTPTSILEKPGKLTSEEYEIMKRHIINGRKILDGMIDKDIIMLATTHHERLDGSGYPDGLTAKDLDLKKRILAVADIVSALRGVRSYKKEFEKEKIMAILQEEAQKGKIDLEVVQVVTKYYDEMMQEVDHSCQQILDYYKDMEKEYKEIVQEFKQKKIIK